MGPSFQSLPGQPYIGEGKAYYRFIALSVGAPSVCPVYRANSKTERKGKRKWNHRWSRTPTAVSMQSIFARVHSQSGI